MSTQVTRVGFWMAHARIGDHRALQELLASLPAYITQKTSDLAQPSMRGRSAMHYDNELKRAYFLVHGPDGVLSCVTFDGVASLGKAALLWVEFHGECELDDSRCAAAYAKVTGLALEVPERRA